MIWVPSNLCSTAWLQTLSRPQRFFRQTQGQGHQTKISSLNRTRWKVPDFPKESSEQSGVRRTLPPQKGAYTTRGGAAAVSGALRIQRENLRSEVHRQGQRGENISEPRSWEASLLRCMDVRGQDADQLGPESQTQRPQRVQEGEVLSLLFKKPPNLSHGEKVAHLLLSLLVKCTG